MRVQYISGKCGRLTKKCRLLSRKNTLANLNLIRYTSGSQCNCLREMFGVLPSVGYHSSQLCHIGV